MSDRYEKVLDVLTAEIHALTRRVREDVTSMIACGDPVPGGITELLDALDRYEWLTSAARAVSENHDE
ncbi:hypothetical protein SEA_CARTHAGE_83 [Mycobacterium phage Carthage]|uniref:Uncharacterized protein n=1 Tax=Mycobacterium phage Robyn TaxID=2530145 RepID=A0A481W0B8_9CAUD|nr:hypothetical protein SEA_CARTHAGE_83 [Mycobacterium phage Carthage]QBI99622.1 hypothetical protein SEA_ROBYN_84 [Mycobacterium phage Robyn]